MGSGYFGMLSGDANADGDVNQQDKITWTGTKSAALYFCDFFEFKLPEFNKCFKPEKGADFHAKNRSGTLPDSSFMNLLNETQELIK